MLERDPHCTRCKLSQTAEFVCLLGSGPKRNEVMIIGEAPGEREDDSGKPFVGRSGQLLITMLEEQGFNRQNCYISNAVHCRPPDNRTPRKGEIKACRYWVDHEFENVKPKYVLLLGNVPLESLLGEKGIKKMRGKPVERDGVIYLPTYHPSFVLRDPTQRDLVESDIRLFREVVDSGKIPEEENLNWHLVQSDAWLKEMMDDLWGVVSFDIETSGLYPFAPGAHINSIGFGTRENQWCLPIDHPESRWSKSRQQEIIDEITERVESGKLKFIMHNGKFDSLWMRVHFGVTWPVFFDTMIAHFLLDENSFHSLKYLSQIFFGAIDYDVDTDTKLGKNGLQKLSFYHAHDLYYTYKLWRILRKKLFKEGDVEKVFHDIMMPCVNLFREIEYRGVYIDVKKMASVEAYLLDKKNTAKKELDKHTQKFEYYKDNPINWGSGAQVAKLLFEHLGIAPIEKTKSGKAWATSESVIKRIDHPLTEALLSYREASKQLSSFIEGWKPFIVKNRLHPSFKLHGTVTGRLSCENPNLQQVPRDPKIRSLITAPPGYVLLEMDLSQIELRIAAELSGDASLVYAFQNGIDPHWLTCIGEMRRGGAEPALMIATASHVAGKPIKNYGEACDIVLKAGSERCEAFDSRWKELRKKAKAVNFGYLYGMWWKKFKLYARDNYGVTVTDKQAEESRNAYFDLYKDLPEWHRRQKAYARRNGYVKTLSGRKRRLPDAMQGYDSKERQGAERQAINSPVQSFANELNLMAALQLYSEFSRKEMCIVGTVHDALLIEVREDMVERIHNRGLEIMRHPALLDEFGIKMRVPIDADAKLGPWGSSVKLSKWLEING